MKDISLELANRAADEFAKWRDTYQPWHEAKAEAFAEAADMVKKVAAQTVLTDLADEMRAQARGDRAMAKSQPQPADQAFFLRGKAAAAEQIALRIDRVAALARHPHQLLAAGTPGRAALLAWLAEERHEVVFSGPELSAAQAEAKADRLIAVLAGDAEARSAVKDVAAITRRADYVLRVPPTPSELTDSYLALAGYVEMRPDRDAPGRFVVEDRWPARRQVKPGLSYGQAHDQFVCCCYEFEREGYRRVEDQPDKKAAAQGGDVVWLERDGLTMAVSVRGKSVVLGWPRPSGEPIDPSEGAGYHYDSERQAIAAFESNIPEFERLGWRRIDRPSAGQAQQPDAGGEEAPCAVAQVVPERLWLEGRYGRVCLRPADVVAIDGVCGGYSQDQYAVAVLSGGAQVAVAMPADKLAHALGWGSPDGD